MIVNQDKSLLDNFFNEFISETSGWKLLSVSMPELSIGTKEFYIRGELYEKDYIKLKLKYIDPIIELLNEFANANGNQFSVRYVNSGEGSN